MFCTSRFILQQPDYETTPFPKFEILLSGKRFEKLINMNLCCMI